MGSWSNPFFGVMSSPTSTLWPGVAETDEGVASTVKSGPRTLTVTAVELDAAKELLPLYFAVTKSLPTGSADVVR